MNYKAMILGMIIILLFSSSTFAGEVDIIKIKELIRDDQYKKAIEILEAGELTSPDLKYYHALLISWQGDYKKAEDELLLLIKDYPKRLEFYNQLARVYGWLGKYKRAEEIINQAQKIEKSAQRIAIVAQHEEWQDNWFKAKELWQEAINNSSEEGLKESYLNSLDKVERKIKPYLYLDMSAQYDDNFIGEFLIGQSRPMFDGFLIEGAVGVGRRDEEVGTLIEGKVEVDAPILPADLSSEMKSNLFLGEDYDSLTYINNLNYQINDKNSLLFEVTAKREDKNGNINSYQTLKSEYAHDFEKTTVVLKRTARHDKIGWIWDFSHHLEFYYPVDDYLLNLEVGYYTGGEYTLRFGVEVSDKILSTEWLIDNFNCWINDVGVKNLRLRINKLN